jgi:zinc protease
MRKQSLSAVIALFLSLSAAGVMTQAQDIPQHPRELKYTTLTFTPPKREPYRHVLANGVVVYLVEDHDLPLINISTLVRTGTYLDPAGKEGLASLTGAQIRLGGTASRSAEEFD